MALFAVLLIFSIIVFANCLGDIDLDGYPEALVTCNGRVFLFHNNPCDLNIHCIKGRTLSLVDTEVCITYLSSCLCYTSQPVVLCCFVTAVISD